MDEPMSYDGGDGEWHPVVPGAEAVSRPAGGLPRDGETESRTPDWRRLIEDCCRSWLDSLEGELSLGVGMEREPEPKAEQESPDMYSFYAELCAVRHEFRKQSRRTTDSLSRFGGILDEFEGVFERLLARLEQADELERQAVDLEAKRAMFLPLVDVYDRLRRLEKHLDDPPPAGLFGGRRRRAWERAREGLAILREHFAALLRDAGVEELVSVDQIFDPRSMKVVEVEETDAVPEGVVLEELAAGYLYRGRVLRLAEVKVARKRAGTS